MVHYDIDPNGTGEHLLCNTSGNNIEFTCHVELVTCQTCHYLLGEIAAKVNKMVAARI
jgi:hypothetical protein